MSEGRMEVRFGEDGHTSIAVQGGVVAPGNVEGWEVKPASCFVEPEVDHGFRCPPGFSNPGLLHADDVKVGRRPECEEGEDLSEVAEPCHIVGGKAQARVFPSHCVTVGG